MKTKHRLIGYIIGSLLLLLLVFLAIRFPQWKSFVSPSIVREYFLGLGFAGYFMYVLFLSLSVPLPIPSGPLVLSGGYIYGLWLGSLLTLMGMVIGMSISFYVVRIFGEPVLEKLVDQHHLRHFNHVFKKNGLKAVFISFAVPLFPNDIVALILGFTNMPFLTFLFLLILGSIPRALIVVSIGEDLFTGLTIRTIILIVIGTIFVLSAIFREKLKLIFFKELRELENEAKTVERDVEIIERRAIGIKNDQKKHSKK